MSKYTTRTRSGTRVVGGLSPTIIMTGDWAKASFMLHGLSKVVAIGSMKGQKTIATKLRNLVRRHIKAGGVPGVYWPPHTGQYSNYIKGHGGITDSHYYQSGTYYRSIKVHKTKGSYHVGIKKGIRPANAKSTITLGEIANVLEHGSDVMKIPARPLWIPTWKSMKGNKGARAILIWNIRNEIWKTFNVRAKVY